jgi:galactoside O-acetyltransferase
MTTGDQPIYDSAKKTHAAVTGGGSALRNYQDVVVGSRSLLATLYYEWCMLFSVFPGALGLLLRKIFWPRLFRSCGKGIVVGANVILRHPNRIEIGERVVISDGCILDARNDQVECAIALGDDNILSNGVMLSCKDGTMKIGARTGLGVQTIIHAVNGCSVSIGVDVMIGPKCYIAGGGNYNTDRTDMPISQQGLKDEAGVVLENDIWLGANVTVLPGVTMGTGSIAGAGAVVTKSVGDRRVCAGVPARVIRVRGETASKTGAKSRD